MMGIPGNGQGYSSPHLLSFSRDWASSASAMSSVRGAAGRRMGLLVDLHVQGGGGGCIVPR